MTSRMIKTTVTFTRPFILGGFDEVQPAGDYIVETDEELLEGISFPVYRRISTIIRLHTKPDRPDVTQALTIDPADLDAALLRDSLPEANWPEESRRLGTIKADVEKADVAAEERSEDDGMAEHPDKSADPAGWRAKGTVQAGAAGH